MMIFLENENSLVDILNSVESFDIFNQGDCEKVGKNSGEFNKILNGVNDVFCSAILMPAFGVSLHKETLNEREKGVWLQINFSEELTKNGLNFNSLLFKLETTQGFNLIRKYKDKYDGRCLYLNIQNEMNLKTLLNKMQNNS